MKQEKSYVIYESPEKCKLCNKPMLDIGIGMTMMKACPFCGWITPNQIAVYESQLKDLNKIGIKAIKELKTPTGGEYIS